MDPEDVVIGFGKPIVILAAIAVVFLGVVYISALICDQFNLGLPWVVAITGLLMLAPLLGANHIVFPKKRYGVLRRITIGILLVGVVGLFAWAINSKLLLFNIFFPTYIIGVITMVIVGSAEN